MFKTGQGTCRGAVSYSVVATVSEPKREEVGEHVHEPDLQHLQLSVADLTDDIDHGPVGPRSGVGPAEPLPEAALSATVVVCVYTEERWGHIGEALDSLESQDVSPLEVVVVVDYNPALLKRLEVACPGLVVVANEHAPGLSGARNTGVGHAHGDVVVFLDDDARAVSDWLRSLLAGYEDKRVIGVGGHVEPVWFGKAPAWLPKQFLWVVGCSYDGLPKSTASIRNLIGANMSFRRSVFAEVGAFREGLGRQITVSNPLGCEETEFAIRAVRGVVGSRILHEPSAVVHHYVPPERTSWGYFVRRCYSEGRSKAALSRSVGTYHHALRRTAARASRPHRRRHQRVHRLCPPPGWRGSSPPCCALRRRQPGLHRIPAPIDLWLVAADRGHLRSAKSHASAAQRMRALDSSRKAVRTSP